MKTNPSILCSVLLVVTSPLYADVSNTNSVIWNGENNTINTFFNRTGDPYSDLSLQVTVNAGYQFDFNSLNIFLGHSGAGSGGAPSPYLQILDSWDNMVATTPSVLLTTPQNGFYSIDSYSSALSYEVVFAPISTVTLGEGTYSFKIWDTGEQLNFMMSGGAINTAGINVTAGNPVPVDIFTPALSMIGTTYISSVPEPSSIVLAGLGGLCLLMLKRRN